MILSKINVYDIVMYGYSMFVCDIIHIPMTAWWGAHTYTFLFSI